MRKFLNTIILIFAITLTAGCTSHEEWHKEQGVVWNTTFNIIYENDVNLLDSIYACFAEIDRSLSIFTPGSTVNRVNEWSSTNDSIPTIQVDEDFAVVFSKSQDVALLSGGLFDPTVGPLVELWGFGRDKSVEAPDSSSVEEILLSVGIGECKLISVNTENGTAYNLYKKTPETRFNFSAIAKGYGCDKVAAMLRRNGVCNYLVEIGGEINVSGISHRGKDWIVQIDAPVPPEESGSMHTGLMQLSVTDCGIATSGNYRNYRSDESGHRYGHTINPLTGYPVQTDVLSATVITLTTMEADALATACMAMTSQEAKAFLESIDGVRGVIVTVDSILKIGI